MLWNEVLGLACARLRDVIDSEQVEVEVGRLEFQTFDATYLDRLLVQGDEYYGAAFRSLLPTS